LVTYQDCVACDTLSKLYDNFGTYSTLYSLHLFILPSGKFIFNVTIPCLVAFGPLLYARLQVWLIRATEFNKLLTAHMTSCT